MKNILYTLEFHSYWHCGSGLASGADADLLVVKDKDRSPFVPGKTIKGLVLEAVQLLAQLRNESEETCELINKTFGYFDGKEKKVAGELFVGNAELPDNEKEIIKRDGLADYLYSSIASTAIGDNGIASNLSLRKEEVVVPCILQGEIKNVDDDLEVIVKDALRMIKRLGSNRNRGLGRCSFNIN